MSYVRYTIVFLVVTIAAAVAVRLLNSTMGSTLGSSAQLMVPAMVGALIEGQQYAKTNRHKPDSRTVWRFVWIATLIASALNVALAFLAGSLAPEFGKLAIAPVLSQQFNILLAIYAGGYLLSNRLFLGLGVSNQLSQMRSRGEIE